MIPLFLIIHVFVGATLTGTCVVVALTLGLDTPRSLLAAALVGFLLAFPVSWIVTKRIAGLKDQS